MHNAPINSDKDYLALRASPFIKFNNNSYGVSNTLFVIQKLFNSLYFELKDTNDCIEKSYKQKNFRTFFTTEFSEKYIFYKLMKYIYPKDKYISLSGDEMKKYYGEDAEPDYYVRDNNLIYLFENKATFISSINKTSLNWKDIEEEILSKLVQDSGVDQIINNTLKILNSTKKYDLINDSNSCVIYPIMVTHYSELDSIGINQYFRDKFKERLLKSNIVVGSDNRVKDLTLINIDFFVYYQNALKENSKYLSKLIDDYHYYLIKKHIYKSNAELKDKVDRIFNSFNDFLLTEITKDEKKFKELGRVLMEEFEEKYFGKLR